MLFCCYFILLIAVKQMHDLPTQKQTGVRKKIMYATQEPVIP